MTAQPVEYRLLDGRVIAPGEIAALTAADWRFLFWLSLETQRGISLATLFDMIADHATSGRRGGAANSAQRLIALDIVERATPGAAMVAEIRDNGFVTVQEAAALRGVSRQAINHLVRDGKVAFVRRGGSIFIDRRSLSRLQGNPRKRLSGRQILMIPSAVVERLAPGAGILCALDRPVLEHAMMGHDFSFCMLRPGSRLSDRDLDTLDKWGVERKGGEAYRAWLKAGARLRGDRPGAAPALPRVLRDAEIWRFRIPQRRADGPIIVPLLNCAQGRIRSLAVLHFVAVDGWGYLDVSFDAPAAAVETLRRNAAARQIRSQATADILSDRPAGSIWCDSLARRFASALRRAIQGDDRSPQGAVTPMLHGAVFKLLRGVVEANYPHTMGLVTRDFWIDPRRTAALAGTPLGGADMVESRTAAARRKRIQGGEFEKSLAEFHGLRLLVERLGWSPETLLERLPRIIDASRWSCYAAPPEFPAAPGATPRRPVPGL